MSIVVVSNDRRHSLVFTRTGELGSGEFQARRLEHDYQQLASVFSSCSQCGGHDLSRPTRVQRLVIPETIGVCSDCEATFMLDASNLPRLLRQRVDARLEPTPTSSPSL